MKSLRRRRYEAKTDYRNRLSLLKSGMNRLVVRKSNRYITAQIVSTKMAQDKVIFGVSSKFLLEKGWPNEAKGSLKNLSAAYLTGYMLGKMAKEKYPAAILDIGMHRSIPKGRLYAFLKGAIDAGMKIPHDPAVLPTIEEIEKRSGKNRFINQLKERI